MREAQALRRGIQQAGFEAGNRLVDEIVDGVYYVVYQGLRRSDHASAIEIPSLQPSNSSRHDFQTLVAAGPLLIPRTWESMRNSPEACN